MRSALLFLVALALTLPAPGLSQDEIPLVAWQAPLFWSPPSNPVEVFFPDRDLPFKASVTSSSSPLPFVAIAPCRQFNSHSGSPLLQNTPMIVAITGAPCSIPVSALAASVNITIFNITGAGGNGVFKVDVVSPPTTAWINYPPTETQRGNAGVVSLTGTGAIVVQVNQGAGSVDFTVDVNGYYAPANMFCIGGDCRSSWNNQDASSVSPLPRDCAPGQVPIATGSYQWNCGNICQAAGTKDCGGTSCTNIGSDPNNCGDCSVVCSSNNMASRTCGGGNCNGACIVGFADCNGSKQTDGCETNLNTSVSNCGSCGTACAIPNGTPKCQSGSCQILACNAPYADCNGLVADGCEVNRSSDVNNCGGCGIKCASGHPCVSGVCQ